MSLDDSSQHAAIRERARSSVDFERVRLQLRAALGLGEGDGRGGGDGGGNTVRIGRYRIIKRIGRGAFGEVFLAFDEKLERHVALKLVRQDPEQSPTRMIDRVYREAKVLGRMSHPNIAHAYDVGEYGDELFIVMQWIEGVSLDQWQDEQPRSWREIVSVYIEAGGALQAAHGMGVIHKDFKPTNVLVRSQTPKVCVIDWGLARETTQELRRNAGEDAAAAVNIPTLTVGFTPKYAAPEQMLGEPVNGQADQFAFCVALFEALFGEAPFMGRTEVELRDRKLAGQVVPYSRGKIPRRIEAALRRGLSPRPEDRFSDMGKLLQALSPYRVRRQWMVGAMAVAVGLALGYGLFSRRENPCADVRAEVDVYWNDEAHRGLEQAFDALQLPYGDGALSRLETDLESYLDGWVREATEACLEQRSPSASKPAGLGAARLQCLDRRLETVVVLLGQLRRPSVDLVARAHELVPDLPPVDDCRRLTVLPATSAPPQVLQELEQGLGEVEALLVAHDWSEASSKARELEERAIEHELERYQIEAGVALGRAQVRTGELAEGVERLERAAIHAERLREEVLAWNAWVQLGRLGRDGQLPKDDVREWIARAEAAARRIDDEHRLQLLRFDRANAELDEAGQQRRELEELLAWAQEQDDEDLARASATSLSALLLTSDPARAIEVGTLAMELSETQLGPQHPLTIGARVDLAQAFLQAARIEDAEGVVSLVVSEPITNPHPYHQKLLQVQAQIALQRGRLDEARAVIEQAKSLRASDGAQGEAQLEQFLGVLAFAEGGWSDAEARFRRVEALAPEPVTAAVAKASVAEALLHQRRTEEALSLAQEARAILETPDDLYAAYLAMPLKVEGLARIVRGDLVEAEALLRAADEKIGGLELLERADVDYALGILALRRGEPGGQARIDRARSAYGSFGQAGATRQEAMACLLEPAE